MKTLSIRPPWAWAILNLGKRIENRSWETSYRGPLLIHAGKSITRDDYDCVARHCKRLGVKMPARHELQTGGIVGICNLSHIFEPDTCDDTDFYADGCYGWKLDDVRPVPFIPQKGRLQLYETPWPVKVAA